MCGIAGIIEFSKNKSINLSDIVKMSDTINHRGPDDAGDYFNQERTVGFGFRRLSIIDIENGHQPMSDSKKESLKTTYYINHFRRL